MAVVTSGSHRFTPDPGLDASGTASPYIPGHSDRQILSEAIKNAWVRSRHAIDSGDKSAIRQLHLRAKSADSSVNYKDLLADLKRLKSYFPQAAKIDPSKIQPIVVPVRPRTKEERLFKISRGYWTMPYSKGYGRRLRFLVMDEHHGAVIGIIGLQSPSADLACRDKYLGLDRELKLQAVNNTLDAYTIGATPTYAPLLAGKLVAGFLHSPIIRQEYWRIYGGKRTTQLGMRIPQPLLAITTASAFGRSSIYNRIKDSNGTLAKPLGYTKGFGTLHLEEIYPQIVEWLVNSERHVPAGFGNGPKVRWQNIMRALTDLNLSKHYLEHGLKRQVYIFELVENLLGVLHDHQTPSFRKFEDDCWSEYWRERWCLPRAQRNPDWYHFDSYDKIQKALTQS